MLTLYPGAARITGVDCTHTCIYMYVTGGSYRAKEAEMDAERLCHLDDSFPAVDFPIPLL